MKKAIATAWFNRRLRHPEAMHVYNRSEIVNSHPSLASGHDASQRLLARSGYIAFEKSDGKSSGTGKWLITEKGAEMFASLLSC